jgi:GntR family transcriptional regulator
MRTARRTAEDRQPKYLRIHAELRDRITSGQWPAGTSLPAQRDLAAEFGVSIMTLRQALQLLADDGLIAARHGSGTYVAARYEYDLGHLRSFAADLAAQGAEIRTRLLAAEIITPADEVSARLGDPSQVLRLRRLRLAAGRPLIMQTSYLPLPLADGLDPADLAERGLYTVLAEQGLAEHGLAGSGLAVTRAAETITPCVLGTLEAGYLERPAGSPALLSHRISFTAAGLAVVDDHAVLPGDSVAISVNRSADRLDVHYSLHPSTHRPPSTPRPASPVTRLPPQPGHAPGPAAGSRTGANDLWLSREQPAGQLSQYARPRAREDVAGLDRGEALLHQAYTMAARHGLDRDLHRGAEARGVVVHRGHVVGQPVRPLDRRDHPLLPEGRPVRHLEGHQPAPARPQIELGAGHPVRPLAVVQRDEGVEDRFRWRVDDALNVERMPLVLACR